MKTTHLLLLLALFLSPKLFSQTGTIKVVKPQVAAAITADPLLRSAAQSLPPTIIVPSKQPKYYWSIHPPFIHRYKRGEVGCRMIRFL